MERCAICDSSKFSRTADDLFICENGHINKDMLVMEAEFDNFNTQTLTQTQQSQVITDSVKLYGHEQYLMYIDAIQYCLVKYTEQLETIVNFKLLRIVHDLWINYLAHLNINEISNDSEETVTCSNAFGILWIACQSYSLPIPFYKMMTMLTPVELPSRYITYLNKNVLKTLSITLLHNRHVLSKLLTIFDYLVLEPPNIELYGAYLVHDFKLPSSIATEWFKSYDVDYWRITTNYFRITFHSHVLWSLYAYVLKLFNLKDSFDLSSWLCQWYCHLSTCTIKPINLQLHAYLEIPTEFKLLRYTKLPTNPFSKEEPTTSTKFKEYCNESVNSLPLPQKSTINCHCFTVQYEPIPSTEFAFHLFQLFQYFSISNDIPTHYIQQTEFKLTNFN